MIERSPAANLMLTEQTTSRICRDVTRTFTMKGCASLERIIILTDAELQWLTESVARLGKLIGQFRSGANVVTPHSPIDEAVEIAGRVHQALTLT